MLLHGQEKNGEKLKEKEEEGRIEVKKGKERKRKIEMCHRKRTLWWLLHP